MASFVTPKASLSTQKWSIGYPEYQALETP
jgi:hypothetical protein